MWLLREQINTDIKESEHKRQLWQNSDIFSPSIYDLPEKPIKYYYCSANKSNLDQA